MQELTVTRLMEIIRECAGEGEGLAAADDVLNVEFSDLGYDSLAMLETASRIERDYGIRLPDEQVTEATTPRAFLTLVHDAAAESS
ncbi:act minimal PKS acyl carrier protein [Thermomonospora echinospora]|uniref:Act minimal PKS acyl carrier protein n=1 Tax=Thermomonospora echinospora TaxID=1992 RepID=A0A1H5TTK1_9ACTN|nr:acyl carrier protein [Thermomonospora echinospora]SEF66124.1 act minimal PKS acyl carrier protein [Thermomonospora echinospora]